jgi:hypothetical protein
MQNQKDDLDALERAQAALRESIEESKRLAERSQSLLDQHRKQLRN